MQINGLNEFKDIKKASGKKHSERINDRENRSAPSQGRGSDAVELSGPGKSMAKLKQVPDVRMAKIEEIKTELERGEYLTDDRIRNSIRNLLKDL